MNNQQWQNQANQRFNSDRVACQPYSNQKQEFQKYGNQQFSRQSCLPQNTRVNYSCFEDQIDLNKRIYIKQPQSNFLEMKRQSEPLSIPFINQKFEQPILSPKMNQNMQSTPVLVKAKFLENPPEKKTAPIKILSCYDTTEINSQKQNEHPLNQQNFNKNFFKPNPIEQANFNDNQILKAKSVCLQQNQVNQEQKYSILASQQQKQSYPKPTFHSFEQKSQTCYQTMIRTMTKICHHCQNQINEQSEQLDCWHQFHRRCLETMLEGQLNQNSAIIQCHCKKKIKSSYIFKKFPNFIKQLIKNQLSVIRMNTNKVTFHQCNECDFFWIPTQPKIKLPKCIYCSSRN